MKSVYDVNNQEDFANLLLQLQEIEDKYWQDFYWTLKTGKYSKWANQWSKEEMEKYIKDNGIEF